MTWTRVMFAAASPSNLGSPDLEKAETTALAVAAPTSKTAYKGELLLSFKSREGVTCVDTLHQAAPCRAMFPGGRGVDPLETVLINVAGGLVGGDCIKTEITAKEDTASFVTSQAAEKVYRSNAKSVEVNTHLCLAEGSVLEWMPHPTILFDGCRLHRSLSLDAASGSLFLGGEMLILGREAFGERLTHGVLRDKWNVRIDGRLVWVEQSGAEDWTEALNDFSRWDNARAIATLILVGSGSSDLVELVRDVNEEKDGLMFGATELPGMLLMRWIGADAALVQQNWRNTWGELRHHKLGLPDQQPVLWRS